MTTILFIAIGVFFGGFTSWMFIQNNNAWIKTILPVGSNVGLFFGLKKIAKMMNVQASDIPKVFSVFWLALIISVIICLYLLIKEMNSNKYKEIKINFLDLLLGQKDAMKAHLDARKKQLDKMLDIEGMEQKEKTLLTKEKYLEQKESSLLQIEQRINEVSENVVKLSFPKDKSYPVTQNLINQLPIYHSKIDRAFTELRGCIENYVDKTQSIKDIKKNIIGLLNHIAMCICVYVFGSHDNTVRVHFRAKKVKDEEIFYDKLIASCGCENRFYEKNLTIMPFEKSLIYWSWEYKRSLLSVLYESEKDFITKGENHEVWKEFMTITFPEIRHLGTPLLTMGISTKDSHNHLDLLFYLSHIKIENQIQILIDKFYKKINKKFEQSSIDFNKLYEEEFIS